MDESSFYIVDVFAESRYSGNQLAVFVSGHLHSDGEMQKLARETNFSETTFIFPRESSGNTFRVRIFTPHQEVPFAGHPTLGTAYIIITELLKRPVDSIVLDLKAGKIPVAAYYDSEGSLDRLVMKQLEPVFGPELERTLSARILGLSEDDLDGNFPVQEVSTGLPVVIAPLKTLAAVQRIKVDAGLLASRFDSLSARGILVFSPETYETKNRLNVRAFFHHYGIPEDPATGSAGGCLAGYLARHRYFGAESFDITVEQGYEIGRKSVLHLAASLKGENYNIHVGGKVVPIARCQLV
ncbi:MAG: phenazine biosynthesis protein [Peptococcaceae bacterium BICA1-7]|nr:MAG: phenazine biosynthesis protein [Peptococcaceae bacterium BICA1-7]HBV97511.1 PhzF family phenazine biosynthesis protein [Desulfotomaculum sp.]